MTKLLVALDVKPMAALRLAADLRDIDCGFKIGVSSLLCDEGMFLIKTLKQSQRQVLLDLKLRDTRDTVRRVLDRVADIDIDWVTVDARVAMEAANMSPIAVIAVDELTDSGVRYATARILNVAARCAGVVCPVEAGRAIKSYLPDAIVMCPGIRPIGVLADNHQWPVPPAAAVKAGIDYAIVGRPIYESLDPVRVTREIVAELGA